MDSFILIFGFALFTGGGLGGLIAYHFGWPEGYRAGLNRAFKISGIQPGDVVELKTGSRRWVVDRIESDKAMCVCFNAMPPAHASYIETVEIVGLHLLKRV